MKFICILLIFGFTVLGNISYGQTNIKFSYDGSGNREERIINMNKSAIVESDSYFENKPLEEKIGFREIKIYPNPTNGILKVAIPDLNSIEAQIQLYDLNGKLAARQINLTTLNEIDITSLPAGVYVLIISIGYEKKEWKIIKE